MNIPDPPPFYVKLTWTFSHLAFRRSREGRETGSPGLDGESEKYGIASSSPTGPTGQEHRASTINPPVLETSRDINRSSRISGQGKTCPFKITLIMTFLVSYNLD